MNEHVPTSNQGRGTMTLPGADPRSLDAVAVVERPVPAGETADAPAKAAGLPARRRPRITVEAAL